MANNFVIKRNDEGFTIPYTLLNQDNSNPNLTGATVTFNVGNDVNLIVSQPATITDAVGGKVSYTITDQDSLYDGLYKAEFVVTFSNGTKLTYPRNGYLTINIQKNVDVNGTNVAIAEIAAKQGDYDKKLSDIMALNTLTASYMWEYTWTTTAGTLTYTLPTGYTLDMNSQWLEVILGGIPVPPSSLNRTVNNQITLIMDSFSVLDGLSLVARWANAIAPISYTVIDGGTF